MGTFAEGEGDSDVGLGLGDGLELLLIYLFFESSTKLPLLFLRTSLSHCGRSGFGVPDV